MAGGCAGIAHYKKEIPYIMIEAICIKDFPYVKAVNGSLQQFTVGRTYIATVLPSGNHQIENDRGRTLVFKQDLFKEHFMEIQ